MQIIKSHGRSFTDKTERKIRKNNPENIADATMAELMAEDALTLSQWIGVIDKIIPKPKNAKPLPRRRQNV